jgi:hypothetical protein
MWENDSCCWVVLCKNNWFHKRQNLFAKHRIPLAETDVFSPPPALKDNFTVRCDECHKEYLYKPSDVLRHNQELPVSFVPHPLFQLKLLPCAGELAEQKAVAIATNSDRRRSDRLPLRVDLFVIGESVERKAFREVAFTTSVSAHGALVVVSTKLELGQTICLKNPGTQEEMAGRAARFGPVYCDQSQVGVDFGQPTLKFWPAVFLPKSWTSVSTQSRAGT